jgi:hypothetical protein
MIVSIFVQNRGGEMKNPVLGMMYQGVNFAQTISSAR